MTHKYMFRGARLSAAVAAVAAVAALMMPLGVAAAPSRAVTRPPVMGGAGPTGPDVDAASVKGQWFKGTVQEPRTHEFHDNVQGSGGGTETTAAIHGVVTNIRYQAASIVGFDILATIVNDTLSSEDSEMWPVGDNSHGESGRDVPLYKGRLHRVKLTAEFAIADSETLPADFTDPYRDSPIPPVEGAPPYIVATNEDQRAWYCWNTEYVEGETGDYYVPAWDFGDIDRGVGVSRLLCFEVVPALPQGHNFANFLQSAQQEGGDVLANRSLSLKISTWIDNLNPGDRGGPSMDTPLRSSNASVFHDVLWDYGDAPTNYPTLLADDGARHAISEGAPWLGSGDDMPDGEDDGQPGPDADGDDLSPAPGWDDENGVLIPPLLVEDVPTNIQVQVGADGYLICWIDFDGDGQWETEDLLFQGFVPAGPLNIPVTPPRGSTNGVTYARFRISSADVNSPDGPAYDGEVEDYPVTLDDPGYIEGYKFYDLNENRIWDADEWAIPGWQFYLDLNENGEYDAGEPLTAAGADGGYGFGPLMPGTYVLRETGDPETWLQTTPLYGHYTIDLAGGETVSNRFFGNARLYDFGDAPESRGALYRTTLLNDGAHHDISPEANPYLGYMPPDYETDGHPSWQADGDDLDASDDEDGLLFPNPMSYAVGKPCTLKVMVTAPQGGTLDAWIDFNGDGQWAEPGERIPGTPIALGSVANQIVSIPFTAPPVIPAGPVFARFRINSATALPPDGYAADGEVEDYLVTVKEEPDHKMHYAQLPDPFGWDVMATYPWIVADDFRCTASGPITNIVFWGSWRTNGVGEIVNIHLSLHEDLRPPDGYSRPGKELWWYDAAPGEFRIAEMEPSPQGWFYPPEGTYSEQDHDRYFRYSVTIPESHWFTQRYDTVYWLDIQVEADGGEFGVKTSASTQFLDDAVWGEWDRSSSPDEIVWSELFEPIGEHRSLDLAFLIQGRGEPVLEPKWVQPPDREYGIDVASWTTNLGNYAGPIVADDFVSDGRPIKAIRWWGSYIGYEPEESEPVYPPPSSRALGFRVVWHHDIPAGELADYSMPGGVIPFQTGYYPLYPGGPVQERHWGSVRDPATGFYEHEFMYELTLEPGEEWNEKEGVVYWLRIDAIQPVETDFPWGWFTAAPTNGFNDDAVTNIPMPESVVWDEIRHNDVREDGVYGSNSVDMAFELLTDVIGRRARKWAQPPDMVWGVNMPSFRVWEAGPEGFPLRADDFVSDGRRITDIHWWGSYLDYMTNVPGPVEPPDPDPALMQNAPLGFLLSWHTDRPEGDGADYSRPKELLREIYVPMHLCHEVFYGTVTQDWWMSGEQVVTNYEHEYQYYVDLLNPELLPPEGEPWWDETNGVIYWLNVQAVFETDPRPDDSGGGGGGGGHVIPAAGQNETEVHHGWGWKTTPFEHKWHDDSVVSTNLDAYGEPEWKRGAYPEQHPREGEYCDLAFEITTDEVGTNQFTAHLYKVPEFTFIDMSDTNWGVVLSSVGDLGSGVQELHACTNLPASNWWHVVTKSNPWPKPFTNTWYYSLPIHSNTEFKIMQKK